MSDQRFISIIIPAYQAERYLDDCVNSVLSQSHKALEVVIVDDGSTDKTFEICEALQAADSRVRVIHQKNGGLSAARNSGLAAAAGEYVLFLDADDFWDDEDALARLVERAGRTNPDVLTFSYKKYFESSEEKIPYFTDLPSMPESLTGKNAQAEYLTRNGLYIASACNKMIRRALISGTDMCFEQGIYSEDIVWCLKLLLKAESLDFICENFYCYRQREGSITHTIDDKKCEDLCDNILKCAELLETVNEDQKSAAERYTAYQLGTFFKNQALSEHPQKECIQKLKHLRRLLKHHGNSRKIQALDLCTRVIGFSGTCSLIRLLYAPKRRKA